MRQEKVKITYAGIFGAMVFILLVSRILVLTSNYNWPIDPVSLQILYLFMTVVVVAAYNKGRIAVNKGNYLVVLGLLLIHTLLWGVVFVDGRMTSVITTQFRSQSMFVVVLCVTIWAVLQLQMQQNFLKCGYYALALVLFLQLIQNLSDVNLGNLANIFTARERTRANFGFGHYNALGTACVCVILMREYLKKQYRTPLKKALDFLILIMAVVMLLCSASRSAITGLLLYYIVYYGSRMDHWHMSSAAIRTAKVFSIFAVVLLAVWALFGFDVSAFLVAAQRSMLFTHTLPMFFKSDKVLLGLGYASNTAYAYGQTPYKTYWLDNAYIYYLVATGIVGVALLMIAFFIIARGLYKRRKTVEGASFFATFVVYAYISLFETALFNSGGLVNYIYIPWFLLAITGDGFHAKKEIKEKES